MLSDGHNRSATHEEVIEQDVQGGNDEQRVGGDAHQVLRLKIPVTGQRVFRAGPSKGSHVLLDQDCPAVPRDTVGEPPEIGSGKIGDIAFWIVQCDLSALAKAGRDDPPWPSLSKMPSTFHQSTNIGIMETSMTTALTISLCIEPHDVRRCVHPLSPESDA